MRRRLTTNVNRIELTNRLKGEPRSRASGRSVPLPIEVWGQIEAHVARYGLGPDGVVFTSPEGGDFINPKNWTRRLLQPAVRKAGLLDSTKGNYTPNTLRHTHASRLYGEGLPPAEVARRLGHSQQVSLAHYSHPLPGCDVALISTIRSTFDDIPGKPPTDKIRWLGQAR